jgi:putative DNA modification/repair radical SAM protein
MSSSSSGPGLEQKLRVLADAAKFDASCSSSGAKRRDSLGGSGIGSTTGAGICHSYAPDGRCISLLKVLLTNWCIYDCLYCVNRESSNVERARFRVDELVQLTLDFYRRNVIEGLFLSSGIVRTPDYTMELIIEVARQLREDHDFRGYIHLKTVPDASDELIARAGRHADRLSINIEMPTAAALADLAPQKDIVGIKRSMARIRVQLDDADQARAPRPARALPGAPPRPAAAPRFAPAGQTTQMVIGADRSDDATILQTSVMLYRSYRLKRVYYSAFSPIPHAAPSLPARAAPLLREHRLYQADWLMRFYGFEREEIVSRSDGMLALDVDPKLSWALAHPEFFPLDLNSAPKTALLRVPGLGVKAVHKLLAARRVRRIRRDDLPRLAVPVARVLPFVVLADHRPAAADVATLLRRRQSAAAQQQAQQEQQELFDNA